MDSKTHDNMLFKKFSSNAFTLGTQIPCAQNRYTNFRTDLKQLLNYYRATIRNEF